MDLYFFLDSHHFDPAITISSFPPTGALTLPMTEKVYICFAYPQDDVWVVGTHMEVNEYASVTIQWSELGLPRDIIASTLIFLAHQELTGRLLQLPFEPGFSSNPSWRANLKIIGNGTSASYQGEFPYGMTKIKGGSIISLAPFIQHSSTIKNYLLYASFEQKPIHQPGMVELRDIKSKKVLTKLPVLSNKVNCLEITDIVEDKNQLLIAVTGIIGIPIFFSEDEHGRKMSVEHTMTPTEYAIYGEQDVKRSIMQKMKVYWSSPKWLT